MRTSESHPLQVAWLPTPELGGRIGLTLAPGKRAWSAFGSPWARDLAVDLDVLRGLDVDLLVPLLEDHELTDLQIPGLVEAAVERGMQVQRLPIVDGGVPDLADAAALVERIVAHARADGVVVVHCRGGLGRAGTIAACALVALGHAPAEAIDQVRDVRPGAIENSRQEAFVSRFATR